MVNLSTLSLPVVTGVLPVVAACSATDVEYIVFFADTYKNKKICMAWHAARSSDKGYTFYGWLKELLHLMAKYKGRSWL